LPSRKQRSPSSFVAAAGADDGTEPVRPWAQSTLPTAVEDTADTLTEMASGQGVRKESTPRAAAGNRLAMLAGPCDEGQLPADEDLAVRGKQRLRSSGWRA